MKSKVYLSLRFSLDVFIQMFKTVLNLEYVSRQGKNQNWGFECSIVGALSLSLRFSVSLSKPFSKKNSSSTI